MLPARSYRVTRPGLHYRENEFPRASDSPGTTNLNNRQLDSYTWHVCATYFYRDRISRVIHVRLLLDENVTIVGEII